MKKALLVTHVSGFVPQFEMNHVRILRELGYEIHYASNFENPSYGDDNDRLKGTGIICHQIDFARSPLDFRNFRALRQLTALMRRERFELIHCHNPMSAALTRLAARRTRTAPLLYTAHGFHFYQGAPLYMWMLYGTMEWLLSFLTSQQICINAEDYEFARRHFHCRRVSYIPGVGIDLEKIRGGSALLPDFLAAGQMRGERAEEKEPADSDTPPSEKRSLLEAFCRLREEKRSALGIPSDACVVISAGELIRRKNHATVIRALAQINNPKLLYLICGHGALERRLRLLVKSLKLEKRVIFAGYRKDLYAVYRAADICVFPSWQEGLPVALLEAMALGLPVVCSDIRGNNELIEEGQGGYRVKPEDAETFGRSIELLAENRSLRIAMGRWNAKKAEQYSADRVTAAMRRIYRGWTKK